MPHNDKRDLLLLPGFMLTEALWDDMRDGLAALGHCHFGDLSQDGSIIDMAAHVLENAPPRFVLFGFSMGGFVAQQIMRQAPERVIALALLNTSSRPQTPQEMAQHLAQIEMARNIPFKGLTSRALAASVHPSRRGDMALRERLQAMALKNGKEVFLRQMGALRSDDPAGLEKINCPTLIVTSSDDALRSLAESEHMAQAIAGSRLVVIPDCGHMTPLEKPLELLAAIRQWLAQI
ncbi:MAG TPA: alpha/beta hydrolase [Herbaspirillum sp.]|jgi:pimeloyl-ACP methyl ester carboxylesterase|nr:alpha/beta hydrolase [Herbaspirillum sp.]